MVVARRSQGRIETVDMISIHFGCAVTLDPEGRFGYSTRGARSREFSWTHESGRLWPM